MAITNIPYIHIYFITNCHCCIVFQYYICIFCFGVYCILLFAPYSCFLFFCLSYALYFILFTVFYFCVFSIDFCFLCYIVCSSVSDVVKSELSCIPFVDTFTYCSADQLDTDNPLCLTAAYLRSKKSDGKESIVLISPIPKNITSTSIHTSSPASITILISMLSHLSKAKWLGRDIILVAVENNGYDLLQIYMHYARTYFAPVVSVWLLRRHFVLCFLPFCVCSAMMLLPLLYLRNGFPFIALEHIRCHDVTTIPLVLVFLLFLVLVVW